MGYSIEYIATPLGEPNSILTLLSAMIALVAAYFTYSTFKLKIGQKARATCTISFSSDLPYISSVKIENQKDRDLVIHEIYVKFGPDIYVDLLDKDFDDKYNIVIPPLSVREIKFGPVFMYNVNTHRVDVEKLFKTGEYKIVLSTSQGKLTCKDWGKTWDAISESLSNHHVAVVRPNRVYSTSSVYIKENFETPAIDFSSYSDEVRYVVKLKKKDGDSVCCPICDDTKKPLIFKDLKFSDDVLKDEESLEKFLNKSNSKRLAKIEKIECIYDVQKIRNSTLKHYPDESMELISGSPLRFYTLGFIDSKWKNFKLRWHNIKLNIHS